MISPRKAREHARACDPSIDFLDVDAIPVGPDTDYNPIAVMLAKSILNPENLAVLYPENSVLTADILADVASEYGIDYIVVYR